MAKKRVAILLEIDTGDKELSCAAVRTDHPSMKGLEAFEACPGVDETYRVFINDSNEPGPQGKPNKKAMLDAAAHEFGHVLSSVFRVPGGMHEDPRSNAEFLNKAVPFFSANKDQATRLYANEVLAWKIAEKIKPDLDQAEKARCLDTYGWCLERAA